MLRFRLLEQWLPHLYMGLHVLRWNFKKHILCLASHVQLGHAAGQLCGRANPGQLQHVDSLARYTFLNYIEWGNVTVGGSVGYGWAT